MFRSRLWLLAMVAAATPTTVAAATLWLHPQEAHPQGTSLSIRPHNLTGPSVDVFATAPGDFQWISIPVTVPSDVQINSVTLCYQLSNAASYISQIRLIEMTAPPTASIQLDDPTDLTSTTSTCITSAPAGLVPAGTITLSLRLNFASTTDVITIGGVGLNTSPVPLAAPEAVGGPALQLRQNHPNPLSGSTTIVYDVPASADVEVSIFDVAGKRVRTLVREPQAAGRQQAGWDRRDDRGTLVAAGTYFYQVRLGTGVVGARRMIVLP